MVDIAAIEGRDAGASKRIFAETVIATGEVDAGLGPAT